MSQQRVTVFLDYQNVYMRARDAFHQAGAPPWDGQVNPVRLAQLLVERGPVPRELVEVRIYRGVPSSKRDPCGYGAARRQHATWTAHEQLRLFPRMLRYPSTYPVEPAREKGVDVQLAIDFVMLAVRREYDVGVLMSGDTDLLPAIEAVRQLGGRSHCEVAAWAPPAGPRRRIKAPGVWCHFLTQADYLRVADPTDYR